MAGAVDSAQVLSVIRSALVNLGEVRADAEFGVKKSTHEIEQRIETRFTDEIYETMKLWQDSEGRFRSKPGFVITTCEGLESFFIPCLDVDQLDIRHFTSNIAGLADCLLADIRFLVDSSLIKRGDWVLTLKGDPYGVHEERHRKAKTPHFRQIPNADAASYILSTCLMAKNFLDLLISECIKKSEYDIADLRTKLNLILNKGMEALIENHGACERKGWPLDFVCNSPSVFGTWAILEFLGDIEAYQGNTVVMEGLNTNLISQLEQAKGDTLSWMKTENVKLIKDGFDIPEKNRLQYRLIIDKLQPVEEQNWTKFEKDLEEEATKVLGVKGKQKLESEFLRIYDKTQMVFSLLLVGGRSTDLVSEGLQQVLDFYFHNDIWGSFIDRQVPLERELTIYGKEEGGQRIEGTLVDYGIVFEVFRMILRYVEVFPEAEIPDEIKRLKFEEKLSSIYERDIISDRCKKGTYKFLWSKPHFELNYTENAIEALCFYYNYLKKREAQRDSVDVPATLRIPIQQLLDALSGHLATPQGISEEKLSPLDKDRMKEERPQVRELLEFWRLDGKHVRNFLEFWKENEKEIRSLVEHQERAKDI